MKQMLKKVLSCSTAFSMLFLAACSAAPASSAPAPASSAAPTSASSAAPAPSASEPVKLSGKVVVYMPSPAGLADKIAAGFESQTGVKVEQFQGTTGEILARLEAEKANPVADVVILASWADGLSMVADDQLMAYVPQNADKMVPEFKEAGNMIYGTSATAVGVIYNTTIFPTLSADWDELADVKYKDQLAIPDPEKSGSCKDFLSGYLNSKGEEKGWATWEALAKNGMVSPGANKAALEAVTTGEKGILIAGVDYNAYASKAKGEPLDIYYPLGGTIVNPRPAMILKTSPNTDNAKAFMDYLLSDEAQKLVTDAYVLPGRTDIPCTNRAGISEIPTLKVDWSWMMANSSEISKKLLELCK